jgi:hypothetical protein
MTDWKAYYQNRKQEVETFLAAADQTISKVGSPRKTGREGERRIGRPPYDAAAMLKVNLLRILWKKTYRDMAAFLEVAPEFRARLGLSRTVSHDTIHRYAEELSEQYLQRFNDELTRRLKKTSYASSSMPQVSRSRGTQDVGGLPRTGKGSTTKSG